jgi:hypothetical protein
VISTGTATLPDRAADGVPNTLALNDAYEGDLAAADETVPAMSNAHAATRPRAGERYIILLVAIDTPLQKREARMHSAELLAGHTPEGWGIASW